MNNSSVYISNAYAVETVENEDSVDEEKISISDAVISGIDESYTYTGSVIKPAPTIKVDGTTLTQSTASAIFKGIGNNKYIFKSVSLSKTKYSYTGKSIKPSVTVKDSSGNKISSKYYSVTYTNNINTGEATVTIKGKGIYKDQTVKKYFYIVPKKVTISSVKSSSTSSITLRWKKSTGSSGYKIAYRKKGSITWKYEIVSYKNLSSTIKGLDKNSYYYIKIRGYKTVNSKRHYGSWSEIKKVRTK